MLVRCLKYHLKVKIAVSFVFDVYRRILSSKVSLKYVSVLQLVANNVLCPESAVEYQDPYANTGEDSSSLNLHHYKCH